MTDQQKAEIITKEICYTLNIDKSELFNRSRERKLVEARQFIFYFIHEYTELGYKSIGKIFNMDHSSVIYSCKNIDNMITWNGYDKKASRLRTAIIASIGMDDLERMCVSMAQF